MAFTRPGAREPHTLPVMHRGQLVGLVTMEDVGEFLLIQAALSEARRRRWRPLAWTGGASTRG